MTLLHPRHKHDRQIAQWGRQDLLWGILKVLPICLIVVPVVAYLATVTIEKAAYEAVHFQPCFAMGC